MWHVLDCLEHHIQWLQRLHHDDVIPFADSVINSFIYSSKRVSSSGPFELKGLNYEQTITLCRQTLQKVLHNLMTGMAQSLFVHVDH